MEARVLRVDRPDPGFYKRKLVRNGPWVGVHIFWRDAVDPWGEPLDRAPVLECIVDGMLADAMQEWSYCAGNPITEEEYRKLRRQAMSADQPASNQPINLNKMPPLSF